MIWNGVCWEHLRDFLLELGVGFAFLGSQYRIQVGEEEFWIDLLFYHVKLRAYVVIDLKMQTFRPEFTRLWKAGRYEKRGKKLIDIEALVAGFSLHNRVLGASGRKPA